MASPELMLYIFQHKDRRSGLVCDLDASDIAQLNASACTHCGRHGQRMTLERMDPSRGHAKDNVVPCCVTCFFTRAA